MTHNVVHKKFEVFLLHGHVEPAGVDLVQRMFNAICGILLRDFFKNLYSDCHAKRGHAGPLYL